MKLSVVIPGQKEPLMQKTINTLLEKSELGSDIEVFAVIDGPWMEPPVGDSRVKIIQFPESRGMRAGINAGIAQATGEFIMKTDAHCSFAQGFDRIMVENCDDNWLLIPRRYSLDDTTWEIISHRPIRDYHYLSFPNGGGMFPQNWGLVKEECEIDDAMTFQGSCWVANRRYFMKYIGFLDDRLETYGTFAAEQLEIGLKYWLGGGKVKVNKKTWYAHLFKMPRHYNSGEYFKKNCEQNKKSFGWIWATDHWMNNKEPHMVYLFEWLIEKFWPVPTWPEDKNQWRNYEIN